MKRIIPGLPVLLIWTILCSTGAISQVDGASSDKPVGLGRNIYGLGISTGLASGIGISFRHHLPSFLSYQLTAGIIKVDEKVHYDFGGELHADIMRSDFNRFYAAGGLGYFYSGAPGTNDLAAPFRVGVGVGSEWNNVAQFHVAAELLLTFFNDGTIVPLPQFSAHYYFF